MSRAIESATDEAIQSLCIAVAKSAAKDYQDIYGNVKRLERKRKALPNRTVEEDLAKAKRELEPVREFFFSEWFHMMFNLEPRTLIRLLEEEVTGGKKC